MHTHLAAVRYGADSVRDVACLAHVRRKFDDVPRSQGPAIAEEAIRRIAQFYAVEAKARGSRAESSSNPA